MIKENPDILTEAINQQPTDFVLAIQSAYQKSKTAMTKVKQEEERQRLENALKEPLRPKIRQDESFRGNINAPLTLVEYSDFECPFCAKGNKTIEKLKKRYGKNIRIIYKHLPLSFHPKAKMAAQYYEAIRLQNPQKAFKFRDIIFSEQRQLSTRGMTFLNEVSSKVGANLDQIKQDFNSSLVLNRIKEDMLEAENFDIQGTPGFILNGIPIKGAYPEEHFVAIVEELKKRKIVETF